MSRQLYRLVYYSRNRISKDGDDFRQAIEEILATSRDNNSRCDVTGALIFNAGCFGQVLEGHIEDVEATFERIQQDERHGDVSLLAIEPIEHRHFAQWSMALVTALPSFDSVLTSIGLQSGFDPSKLNGDELHSVLHRLLLEEEAFLAQ
ncbi:BLUF domain-containing protein [Mycoplana dimorpha]|uniref:FAD-dependent sensor of blue light n=1 Tax=Mycoplana dimorpha TaxID=28320 RepID=A0A2T5BF36_MYCDI|nr:BLUF domain-containing protein [Mycoplana dimorpha]PTM97595.1 FAD-dependent sensor of blue light [Mycoplana dimorpha]